MSKININGAQYELPDSVSLYIEQLRHTDKDKQITQMKTALGNIHTQAIQFKTKRDMKAIDSIIERSKAYKHNFSAEAEDKTQQTLFELK